MKYNEIDKGIIGIYKINFPNNKVYIGLSKDIKRRIKEHFWNDNSYACDEAVRKYYKTLNELDFEILEQFEKLNYSILSEKEMNWIQYFKSDQKEYGYNLTSGGLVECSNYGLPWSRFKLEEIKDIHKRLLNGESNVDIAKDYNVDPITIGHINQGLTYRNPDYKYPLRDNSKRKSVSGLNNPNSIPYKIIIKACELLKENKYTYQQIADETGTSWSFIAKLNTGKISYKNELPYSFPIQTHIGNRRHPLNLTEGLEIIELLKEFKLTQKEIASIYKCDPDSISKINNGKLFKQENENYPLRKHYPHKKSK